MGRRAHTESAGGRRPITGDGFYVISRQHATGPTVSERSLASSPPDGEGFEPRFGGRERRVRERIRERRGSSFYLTKDTFDNVSIATAAHTKSEAESVECSFEVRGVIDEKRDVRHLLFLSEFTKGQNGRCAVRV